jgi:hypothetical protein
VDRIPNKILGAQPRKVRPEVSKVPPEAIPARNPLRHAEAPYAKGGKVRGSGVESRGKTKGTIY